MSTAFGQCPPIRSRKQQISHHYSSIDSTFDDNNDILRDSLQTAVLDKIRDRLNDLTQLSKAQIDSLRKTEQDLNDGQFKIQSFIQNIQQQQNQAQVSVIPSSSSSSSSSLTRYLELFNKSSNENRSIKRSNTKNVVVINIIIVFNIERSIDS